MEFNVEEAIYRANKENVARALEQEKLQKLKQESFARWEAHSGPCDVCGSDLYAQCQTGKKLMHQWEFDHRWSNI